jgi:ribose/xylose/arabinose/galactoside ABC-type transport system permease subunit
MTHPNLYRPPDAPTADFRPDGTTSARPISAWLLEALLVFIALAAIAGLWRMAWAVALEWQGMRSPSGLAIAVAWQVGLLVGSIASIHAIHRGRSWARWLGLALIVAFGAFCLLRTDNTVYPNDAQRAGAELGRYFMLPVLYVWWAWAFAFSAKAKRFFARRAVDAA